MARTTLTLDPDVVRLIEEEVHRLRKPFKHVVNDALRRGLASGGRRTPGDAPTANALIVPDVNLLLYAHVTGFPEHAKARRAPALFGFVRLATNAQVFDRPLGVDDALRHVERWMSRPHVRFVVPGPHHLDATFRLLRALGAAGNLTSDAQLAALAIEHQGELHSNDTDFARFAGLRWVKPLR